MTQEGVPDCLRVRPRWSKMASTTAQEEGPRRPRVHATSLQDGPRGLQDGPRGQQRFSRRPRRGPNH
eukprot:8826944-Pyramimonas_sp.AAC.1